MGITELSALDLRERLFEGKITSKELVEAYLVKIEEDQKEDLPLNALTQVMKEEALKMAEEADEKIKKGERLPLLGIPVIIKDNINIKGFESTCASHILEGYEASFDATVIKKLKDAGAVLIAKSNMDEFAMGSSSEHSAFGIVRNPVDRERIPGGSSGGSAAAIKAKWAPLALGSDTGGSIRQPASLCGVVGMKPTYGRVSRYGLIAYSSSLDQIGPFANTVKDTALLLEVISGHDDSDSTSSPEPQSSYLDNIDQDIKGKKIGLAKEYYSDTLNPVVKSKIDEAVEILKSKGCEFVEISLPHTDYGIPTYYIIAPAEASSNLSRFDGIRYGKRSQGEDLHEVFLNSRSKGFGTEVKRRIMLGTYVLSSGYYDAYYLKAQKVRTLIKQDFVDAFKEVDAILAPTSPGTAFKIGEKTSDPLEMYLSDIYTVNVNLAGLPGISIPFGEDSEGLPIGVQIIGNYFKEADVLNIANHIEEAK